MNNTITSMQSLKPYWDVLVVFLIPFGGGIPSGVLLAQKLNMAWPIMTLLYFISDVILACIFEPTIYLFIKFGKNNLFLTRLSAAFREATKKVLELHGNRSGVLSLITIAFGVDPMTGRAAAIAAGHGFITGWMIAIAGDMIYFSVLMVSTLWLNDILGDGTTTTAIILALMIFLPMIIRKFKKTKGID